MYGRLFVAQAMLQLFHEAAFYLQIMTTKAAKSGGMTCEDLIIKYKCVFAAIVVPNNWTL